MEEETKGFHALLGIAPLGPALLHGAGQAQVDEGDDMLHGNVAKLQGESFMSEMFASGRCHALV